MFTYRPSDIFNESSSNIYSTRREYERGERPRKKIPFLYICIVAQKGSITCSRKKNLNKNKRVFTGEESDLQIGRAEGLSSELRVGGLIPRSPARIRQTPVALELRARKKSDYTPTDESGRPIGGERVRNQTRRNCYWILQDKRRDGGSEGRWKPDRVPSDADGVYRPSVVVAGRRAT